MLVKPRPGNLINWDDPLSRGLVFAAPFNECAGNYINDVSAYKMDLTGANLQWQTARFGRVPYFDGTASMAAGVTRRHTSGFTRGFSVCGWIRFDVTDRRFFWSCYDTTNNQRSWMVEHQSPTRLHFWISENGSTTNNHYISYTWGAGQWHHLAVIWRPDAYPDGGVAGRPRFVVDGVDLGSHTTLNNSSIFKTTAEFQVGSAAYDNTRNLVGCVESTVLYNRALRIVEIQRLMRDPHCLLRRRVSPTMYYIPSAAPPSFNPVWAAHNNTVIGAA